MEKQLLFAVLGVFSNWCETRVLAQCEFLHHYILHDADSSNDWLVAPGHWTPPAPPGGGAVSPSQELSCSLATSENRKCPRTRPIYGFQTHGILAEHT